MGQLPVTTDRAFCLMVAYFWKEHSDPARYVAWDEERCRKLLPDFLTAWKVYKMHRDALDLFADKIAADNDPDR